MSLRSPADFGLPYVPERYTCRKQEYALLWHHPTEPIELVEVVGRFCDEAFERTAMLLGFTPSRTLHFCMFHSESAFRTGLGRPMAASWFLAPFASDTDSLIVFASPSVYLRNGTPQRTIRCLCHEIVHSFNAEASRSRKRLGDGNCEKQVASWFDEGLAVIIAAKATESPGLIERYLALAPGTDASWDEDRLNRALDALDCPEREEAFAVAVRRVLALAKSHESIAAFYKALWSTPSTRA